MSIQRALLLLVLGAVAPTANAQERAPAPVSSSQRGGFDRIREADLRADLGFVSSDGLQGRMSLQPGDGAAIAWVAAEFAKAGLMPAATNNAGRPSFLQPVPLVEYRPSGANNVLTLKSGGVTRELESARPGRWIPQRCGHCRARGVRGLRHYRAGDWL